MKKSANSSFELHAVDPAPKAPAPSKKEMAATWDIVIRAHYLAHELRYYCGRYDLASSAVANAVAENLEKWATRFGAELEAMEREAGRR